MSEVLFEVTLRLAIETQAQQIEAQLREIRARRVREFSGEPEAGCGGYSSGSEEPPRRLAVEFAVSADQAGVLPLPPSTRPAAGTAVDCVAPAAIGGVNTLPLSTLASPGATDFCADQ